jgi:hypothetical protein
MGLKLNGTHELLVYDNDVNLLEDNIDALNKNTGYLIVASKEVGLDVNAEKTKYMLLSRHQNAGQDLNMQVINRSFDDMAQFKYLGTTVTNPNLMQENINKRFSSNNACYHSVHNPFVFSSAA